MGGLFIFWKDPNAVIQYEFESPQGQLEPSATCMIIIMNSVKIEQISRIRNQMHFCSFIYIQITSTGG